MKTQDSMQAEDPSQTPSPLFPAPRITKLLLDLKASLGQAEGQSLSYDDWAQIAGRPANTIASWCAGGAAHQLEVLLASMERLTAEERHRLIDRACRDYPTLRHPKLAHDFVACSHLATLVRQPSGLTFIQGAPEHMRTFLLSALGNSASSPDLKKAAVAGVDIHQPDQFVPVIGLIYLGNLLRSGEIERQFKQLWPTVRATRARLVLLNDIWRRVPALQPEIMDLARTSHVVVADALALKPGDLTSRVPTPTHLVAVSPAREQPAWIRVEIQAI
ncbi:MAG TPA: hypothetical protein VIL39_00795 [Verrucomicrobiae bacterium]